MNPPDRIKHQQTTSIMPSPIQQHSLFQRWPTQELKKQQAIAFPLAIMNLTWFTKTVVTTAFLSRLGNLHLAAGALGFTFANVTGFSVLTGLSGAMEPICGQAYGAKNHTLMHTTLAMTTLLLLSISIPISLLWLHVDRVLELFGQHKEITRLAKTYVVYLLPDLVATSLLCPLKAYLSSQGVTVPILVSTATGLVVHVPVSFLLAKAKGLEGVAMAVWVTDFGVVAMLVLYVFVSERKKGGSVKKSGRWWEKQRGDWLRLLGLAGPCCLTTCLEWWCYEILMLLTGRLHNTTTMVAVLAVVLNFDYLLFSIMLSLATCVSTRVSNELGAGKAMEARAAAYVTLVVSVVFGCIGGLVMATSGGKWGLLFSHDGEVVNRVKKMMLVMALIEVVNFPLNVCGGIVRGTARPQLGMFATLGGFYLVALPLGVLLGFKEKLGLGGLLFGFLAGATTSVAVLLVLVGRIDWVGEARKAQELARAGKEESGCDHKGVDIASLSSDHTCV